MKKLFSITISIITLVTLSSCIIETPPITTIKEIDYTIERYLQTVDSTSYEIDAITVEKDPLGTFKTISIEYDGFYLNEEISNHIFVVDESLEIVELYYDRLPYQISFYLSSGLYDTQTFLFGQEVIFPNLSQVIGWKNGMDEVVNGVQIVTRDDRFYAIEEDQTAINFEGYYAVLNDVEMALWYETLQEMIQSYTYVSYGDARDILQDSDEDPNNQDNVLLIYNRDSVLSTWDAGVTWNREHVWPRSKLPNSTSEADLHLLRASNPVLNSTRGNLSFVDGSGEARIIGSGWFPGEEDRGDVARIVFYVIMMWETNINLIGDLDTFLKWHKEDPVDDFERQRNQVIYAYQRNRNPFIDYPELVSIFYPTTPQNITFEFNTIPSISYREKHAQYNVHAFL
ncbi:MAG: endonuclease I family protein [Acholeplasmataceae bacterium]